ncbi:nuclear transport factor 2 family protein [Novosphingobium aquimarinum]|uniref:nuclear transport factor 2 family protein n=1 Tax=Novosphingobium aquimarinum TaxID=2682494 RepID=UPI0012EC07B5|nr:nuclear transport factor 2 family protein [Novosphingobium aquimarinum]
MNDAALAITNLLHIYAERMDAGDLEGVAALFEKARIRTGDGEVEGSAPMLELWRRFVKLHPDGTPRTKHVITNPILEIDEDADRATCRSYYTVLQAAPDLPLQVVCAGRYHDVFVREAGAWRFAERDYSMLDLVGDMSQHMLVPVAN